MKTTETWFDEFYNEVRYQIEQGAKADFTRSNQIWAEYSAQQADGACTCANIERPMVDKEGICFSCHQPRR